MGLTPEEYAAYTDPTHGESRAPTKKETKQQAKLASKIDVARYQSCMLQANPTPVGEEVPLVDGSRALAVPS